MVNRTSLRGVGGRSAARVVAVSVLLMFFTLPHTLEDFAVGEPEEAGVPAAVLALVISVVFAVQALGIYWLGAGRRRGLVAHALVGVFWPVAAGIAQLPVLLSGEPYRDGVISVVYVVGIIVVGAALAVSSLWLLRAGAKTDPETGR